MSDLKCPICPNFLSYEKASTDDGGSYYKAYVFCTCGFKFTPPGEYTVRVGECGWDGISRDIKEKEIILYNMFKIRS